MAILFSLLPPIEELPHYNTKFETNMELSLLKVESEAQPNHAHRQNIQRLGKPIAHKLADPNPSLEKQFSNYLSWNDHLLEYWYLSSAQPSYGTYVGSSQILENITSFAHSMIKTQDLIKTNLGSRRSTFGSTSK